MPQDVTKKSINVLSLFDGISCAYLALKDNFTINKYYSSEIDKQALAVQNHHYSHYSNFIKLGDVRSVDGVDIIDVDLVVMGSPCTQLSSINSKDRSGLEGSESGLFYEAVRILKDLKACQHSNKKLYFLMENVASMSNENRDKITAELKSIFGNTVKLLKIDSALVAPAHRRRYYWTNIPNVTVPKPIDIKYQDIVQNGFVDKDNANVLLTTNVTLSPKGLARYYKRGIGNVIFKDEAFAKIPKDEKLLACPFIIHKSGHTGKAKAVTNELDFVNGCFRHPSIIEMSRLMGIPDEYVNSVPSVSRTEKQKLIGLAFTVPVVAHLLKPLKDV